MSLQTGVATTEAVETPQIQVKAPPKVAERDSTISDSSEVEQKESKEDTDLQSESSTALQAAPASEKHLDPAGASKSTPAPLSSISAPASTVATRTNTIQDDSPIERRKRRRTTPTELSVLEAEFRRCPRPARYVREMIAMQVGMTDKEVQVWFQNKRQSYRRAKELGPDSFEQLDQPTRRQSSAGNSSASSQSDENDYTKTPARLGSLNYMSMGPTPPTSGAFLGPKYGVKSPFSPLALRAGKSATFGGNSSFTPNVNDENQFSGPRNDFNTPTKLKLSMLDSGGRAQVVRRPFADLQNTQPAGLSKPSLDDAIVGLREAECASNLLFLRAGNVSY